eukprot:TRINITY_DN2118_c0_g1_i6.p1 TRINITY_DN2118_c0_g1~~TRINITY_DN2118_c0_g1_i6.p1  ORF type:complete len:619 (-),score=225.99 TRINITY_DN2118_c0_g1_i6:27-1883(-)
MSELDFVINAMNLAHTIVHTATGNQPKTQIRVDGQEFFANGSWSALMRASSKLESSRHVQWAEVVNVKCSLFVLRGRVSSGETDSVRRHWLQAYPNAIARVVRTTGTDEYGAYYYELQIVKTIKSNKGQQPEYASFALNSGFRMTGESRGSFQDVLAAQQTDVGMQSTVKAVFTLVKTITDASEDEDSVVSVEGDIGNSIVEDEEDEIQSQPSQTQNGFQNRNQPQQFDESKGLGVYHQLLQQQEEDRELEEHEQVEFDVSVGQNEFQVLASHNKIFNGALSWFAKTLNDTSVVNSNLEDKHYAIVFHNKDDDGKMTSLEQESVRQVQLFEQSSKGEKTKYRRRRHRSTSLDSNPSDSDEEYKETEGAVSTIVEPNAKDAKKHIQTVEVKQVKQITIGGRNNDNSDEDEEEEDEEEEEFEESDDDDDDDDQDVNVNINTDSETTTVIEEIGELQNALSVATTTSITTGGSEDERNGQGQGGQQEDQEEEEWMEDGVVSVVRPIRSLKVNHPDMEHIILLCVFESMHSKSHLDATDEELWLHFRSIDRMMIGETAGNGSRNSSRSGSRSGSNSGSRSRSGSKAKPKPRQQTAVTELSVPTSPGIRHVDEGVQIVDDYGD